MNRIAFSVVMAIGSFVFTGIVTAQTEGQDVNGASGSVQDGGPCQDVTPPEIDHARLWQGGGPTVIHSGYIDPRRDSNNGVNINQGMKEFTFIFTEPVFDVGSNAAGEPQLTLASFSATETGGAAPPIVISVNVDPVDPTRVRIMLNRLMTRRQWTSLHAHVEDACSNVIPNMGNLGPGINEPDRIDTAPLCGDIDQDGDVDPLDLLRFKQIINGHHVPACLGGVMYVDIDRSGGITPLDLIAFKRGINGLPPCVPRSCSWAGVTLLSQQP